MASYNKKKSLNEFNFPVNDWPIIAARFFTAPK